MANSPPTEPDAPYCPVCDRPMRVMAAPQGARRWVCVAHGRSEAPCDGNRLIPRDQVLSAEVIGEDVARGRFPGLPGRPRLGRLGSEPGALLRKIGESPYLSEQERAVLDSAGAILERLLAGAARGRERWVEGRDLPSRARARRHLNARVTLFLLEPMPTPSERYAIQALAFHQAVFGEDRDARVALHALERQAIETTRSPSQRRALLMAGLRARTSAAASARVWCWTEGTEPILDLGKRLEARIQDAREALPANPPALVRVFRSVVSEPVAGNVVALRRRD